jgi:transposase
MTTMLSGPQPPVYLELRDAWVQRGHGCVLSGRAGEGLRPTGWDGASVAVASVRRLSEPWPLDTWRARKFSGRPGRTRPAPA